MEKLVTLKRDVRSKIGSILIPKGSMVIYNSNYKAIETNSQNRFSTIWISVQEKDFEELAWLEIETRARIQKTVNSVPAP